jgi:hypothetical protein
MKKVFIITILFQYLRGEAQYLNLFNRQLIEFPPVKNVVSTPYPDFIKLLTQEKQTVDARRNNIS